MDSLGPAVALRARVAEEHLRIQASLARCDTCGHWFRDITDHVDKTVTVLAVDPEPDPMGYGT